MDYVSRLDEHDQPLIGQMWQLAAQYPRYDYRRIHILLRRAGYRLSVGRTRRLWNKANLQIPCKRPRRHVASQRDQVHRASETNGIWAYDFVFDTCANRRQQNVLR